MFSMKTDKSLFNAVKEWIASKENDKVKFILEHTAPTGLVGENDVTLLHLAAMYGNLHMMEYFINIGCEIDAKDDKNHRTPLMLATINQHWEATKFLLERNADIFTNDSSQLSTFSILMQTDTPNLEILQLFFDQIKRKSADKKEFVAKLIEYDCPLNKIIHLHDAEITQIFLNTPGADSYESNLNGCSINIAMRTIDEENLTTLLLHGEKSYGRREDFARCFQYVLEDTNFDELLVDASMVAVKLFVRWRLLDHKTIYIIEHIFRDEPAAGLRIVLDEAFVKYVNSILGYDVRIHMFANRNPSVLQMIKDGEINNHLLGKRGETALHLATQGSAVETMEYLLECGLRPNVRDMDGQTPIFHIHFAGSYSLECTKILLENGADLQATDNSGNTYIDYCWSLIHDSKEIVIKYLSILQASRVPLKESFLNHVLSTNESIDNFQKCCTYLVVLQKLKVHSTLTLFETLTENIEGLIRRTKSLDLKKIHEIFISCGLQQNDNDYYKTLSRNRLYRAVTINYLRNKAVAAISDGIEVLKPYYLVIEKICSFLSYYDLRVFAET